MYQVVRNKWNGRTFNETVLFETDNEIEALDMAECLRVDLGCDGETDDTFVRESKEA